MSEQYSVKAILSAEDGSFRSVFNNAQGLLSRFGNSTGGVMGKLSNMKTMVKSGLGFGIWSGIGQRAFDVVGKAVQGVTSNLGSAISRFDTLKTFPKIMEMMDFPGAEKATQRLSDAIDGLPTTLDGITRSTQTLALTMGNIDDATDTAIALNNAFLMSGASAEEAERGTTQFVQMLSVGKVDMASWTSLCQTMGPALTKVAESFGYTGNSAKTDLYQALKDGDITFDQFNKRLSELNGKTEVAGKEFAGFAELAKEGSKGIGTSIENLKVTITKNLANMIKAFDESGLSIADSLDGIKTKINDGMKAFIGSDTFKAIVDAGLKTKEALVNAFDGFANGPAMQAVKESLNHIAHNLGETIPNLIKGLSPILEGVVTTIAKIAGAISDVVNAVTASDEFMKFAQAIGDAIERIGTIAAKVIPQVTRYLTAIMDAAADVINAFGEAADAIMDSAHKANSADKAYSNFQKVLGIVKGALMGVADFLKKHHGLILWIIEHLPTIIALIGATKIALMGMQKIQAFVGLISQVKSFGDSIGGAAKKVKDFVSGIGKHFSSMSGATKTAGDAVYSLVGKFTNVETGAKGAIYNVSNAFGGVGKAAGKAGQDISNGIGTGFTGAINVTSSSIGKMSNTISSGMGGALSGIKGFFSNVGSTISGALSNVASGVGTAVGKVASGIGSVVSTIGSIAGPIAMVAGPAIAAITGIVNAVIAWREKQKEIGRDMAAFTEEQQALIDKNKELAESYDQLKESTVSKMQDADAEAEKARALKASYDELLDTNGKVIDGKEKQAESIQGRLYEALGIEKSQVDDLRTEYLGLVDDNGKIKEGYEGRAKAIEAALSEIVGHEISGRDQVLNINNEIMQSIDSLIEKKRLQAQIEVLDDAYIESAKKKKELINEEKDLITQLTDEQKKYHDFLHSKGVEREEDLKGLSAEEQGYFDGVRGNLETLEKSIQSNRDKQIQCEQDKIIAQDAWKAASEEDYGAVETLMARYEGNLLSAQEAVRLHGATAKEVLDKQVSDAQTAYDEIKAAYENGEEGINEIQVQSKQRYLEYAKAQQQEILANHELGLAQELEAEVKNHQDKLAELESHMSELKKKKDYQYSKEYSDLKNAIENEKGALSDAETNWQNYIDNINNISETGHKEINDNTTGAYNQMNSTVKAGTGSMTSTTSASTNQMVNLFSAMNGLIPPSVANTMNQAVSSVKNAQPGFSSGASGDVSAVTGIFSTLPGKVGASTQEAMNTGSSKVAGSKSTFSSNANGVISAIVGPIQAMNGTIARTMSENMNSMNRSLSSGGSTARQTADSIRNSLYNSLKLQSSIFVGYGSNIIAGLNSGMWGMAGRVFATARSIANSVASTIASALQIHSPSKLTTKYGEYVVQGLVNGIKNNVNKIGLMEKYLASQASENFSSKVLASVDKQVTAKVKELNKELQSYKDDQNASHATYTKDKRATLTSFNQQKNKELSDYIASAKKTYNDTVTKIKRDYNLNNSGKGNQLVSYIEDQNRQLQKRLNSINNSKSKNKTAQRNQAYADYSYNIQKKKAALAQNASTKEQKYLNKLADAKVSYEDKVANRTNAINRAKAVKLNSINDDIAKNQRKVNANIAAQEKKTAAEIKKVQDQKNEDYVQAAQKRLDTLKHYNKINSAQEVEYWQNILAICKKGTDGYDSAYMKLYDAKKALKEETAEMTKNYVTDITNKFKELEDVISSRADSLRNAFGLFEKAVANEGTAKSDLISNLESQIEYYKKYDEVMNSLKKKFGGNSEMYQALQGMDIKDLSTLEQIDQMTKAEREAYVKLYQEKQELTRQRAEYENKALENSVKNQMNSLTKSYESSLISLGLGLQGSTEEIGKQIVSGITAGLNEGKKDLDSVLKDLANTMIATVKSELDIHSPSRVMEFIGNMTTKGLINGLQENSKTVERVATGIAEDTTKALDNIVVFPTIGNIQKELRAINSRAGMEINSKTLENFGQTIVVQAELDVDGRKFAQTMSTNNSRAQYESKMRRRA